MQRSLVAISAAICTGGLAAAALGAAQPPRGHTAVRCGTERWPVKTLTDRAASRVSFRPRSATVIGLRSFTKPSSLPQTRIPGVEFHTYRITAQLVTAKVERDDSDIHLVVADLRNRRRTMIVEFPNAGCLPRGTVRRTQMVSARASFEAACGRPPQTFVPLAGRATITGVGFFDRIHNQRGHAPNGIELHPVLAFRSSNCRRTG